MVNSTAILNASVLIVDDQEGNVLLLVRMLRGAGYVSITSTMDPSEVCELHLKNRYDLILLDLQMPGLDEDFVDKIFFASPMHDIGKIGIPDHILLKPGGFTPDELEVMKGHTSMGSKILGNSKSPYLKMGAEIALNHHERWDGGGYPNGKRGEAIPLTARIMNICDIYTPFEASGPTSPHATI